MKETSLLVSSILSVVHPQQYQLGLLAHQAYVDRRDETIEEIVREWASPFNGLAAISNRATPPHRDSKSDRKLFDFLMTLKGDAGLQLELPTLGLHVPYPSGTIVAVSGKQFLHAVARSEEERMCLVWYMRPTVLRNMDVGAWDWMREVHSSEQGHEM